jgi:signal transduction histidine kinase
MGEDRLRRAIRATPAWQIAVGAGAIAAAVAAVWITLGAGFLRYPGWLAAQKADFILGPVFTGLYWYRRRPHSRFGPILIGFGLIGAVYVLQSSSNSWLFSIGLLWENVIGLATYALILAFPSGRMDRPAGALLAFATVAAILPATLILLLLPQVGAGGSISSCRALCPANELAVADDPGLALDLFDWFRWAVIAVAAAIAALLLRRLVTGTPPQRRALAIGTPIALLVLWFQITFQLLGALGDNTSALHDAVVWGIVAARAALWYGFLFALVAAELFAARAVRRLVGQSLRRPGKDELEAMLREPLGDPDLELRFPADSAQLPSPPGGRAVTLVQQEGVPPIAVVHDPQLKDDPELLDAAGAIALLAAENAELDAGWTAAMQELRRSRARLVRAADDERRKLERNLHDGVQQQLIAIKIRLDMAADASGEDAATRGRLVRISDNVEAVLAEVREVGHGLYPPVLTSSGLQGALARLPTQAAVPLDVDADRIARYPPEIESAVYYCCLEAVQNATKHGGGGVHIRVTLAEADGELHFSVADDGQGFRQGASEGVGLQNMADRLGAVGGRLSVDSAPGAGTKVSGRVPLWPTT